MAKATELASSVKASLLRELSHAFGLLEVHLASERLQLPVVKDLLLQLIQRTLETSVQIDLVPVKEKWSLEGRFGVDLLFVIMFGFVIISSQELRILELLNPVQFSLQSTLFLLKLVFLS